MPDNPYLKYSPEQLRSMIAEAEGKKTSQPKENPYLNLSRDELKKKIAEAEGREEPEEQKKSSGTIGKSLARGTKDVVAGMASIPDLLASPIRGALNLGAKAIGSEYRFNPMQEQISEGIDTATGGYTTPQNKSQRNQSMIQQELAGMIPGAAVAAAAKGAQYLGKGAQKAAKFLGESNKINPANVAATTGSTLGVQKYLEHNQDPGALGLLGSSLAGSIGGGYGAMLGAKGVKGLGKAAIAPRNTAAEWTGRTTGFSPEEYERSMKMGYQPSLGSTSNKNWPTQAELVMHKLPASEGIMENLYKGRESSLAKKLGISTPEDLAFAVKEPKKELAQKGAKGFGEAKSKEYERLSKEFEPRERTTKTKREMVDVSDILKTLGEEGAGLTSDIERTAFSKTLPGQLKDSLEKYIPGFKDVQRLKKQNFPQAVIDQAMEKLPKEIPYAALDLERKNALKLKDSLKRGTAERQEAGKFYNALASKRHEFMEKIGTPSEISNSTQARKLWAQYASKNEGNKGLKHYVYDLTGTDNVETAFGKLKQNPKYFKVAREGLPKHEQPMLAEAFLADLGERQGKFNLATAHTGFSDLPASIKKEYFMSLGSKTAEQDAQQAMEFIGKNKSKIEKLANTSGTAHMAQTMDLFKRVGKAAYTLPLGIAMGHPIASLAPAAGLAMSYFATHGTAKLWTDPRFLRRINDVISAKNTRQQVGQLDLLLKLPSVKELLKSSTYRATKEESKR